MEQQVVIEGPTLLPFLHYLKKEENAKKEKREEPDFTFKGQFNKGLDNDLSADLVGILLTGLGSSIIQLVVNYFCRGLNNDAVIKIPAPPGGKEITITLKNRTDKEVIEILKQAGVE